MTNIINKTYVSYGVDKRHFKLKKFKKLFQFSPVKPSGGLWACDVVTNDWYWWSIKNQYNVDRLCKKIEFNIAPESKVLVIDEESINTLPVKMVTKYSKHYDFDKIAEEYDAIYIKKPSSSNKDDYYKFFYMYDVESLVVINPKIIRNIR